MHTALCLCTDCHVPDRLGLRSWQSMRSSWRPGSRSSRLKPCARSASGKGCSVTGSLSLRRRRLSLMSCSAPWRWAACFLAGQIAAVVLICPQPQHILQKAFVDRESTLLHKERAVGEDSRSLEERLASVTTREGRVQGLEALKVQLDADKASMEQRWLQLDNTETQVGCTLCGC